VTNKGGLGHRGGAIWQIWQLALLPSPIVRTSGMAALVVPSLVAPA
jgi:hypothetical protein